MFSNDGWPEHRGNGFPHVLDRVLDFGQFGESSIGNCINVVDRHKQTITRSEASDSGQQHPSIDLGDDAWACVARGEFSAELAIHPSHLQNLQA
jgi:hypothetical protein